MFLYFFWERKHEEEKSPEPVRGPTFRKSPKKTFYGGFPRANWWYFESVCVAYNIHLPSLPPPIISACPSATWSIQWFTSQKPNLQCHAASYKAFQPKLYNALTRSIYSALLRCHLATRGCLHFMSAGKYLSWKSKVSTFPNYMLICIQPSTFFLII